ncbi:DUF5320 domain-containing protein [Desulfatirhabdium butyrativorans]|uniref:DUF5320 domain-containing protein n=1 Tax=Desulfatirhabdium butyrativorans TaxID=340467 RepID=UPI00041898D6|nr:DUF5320 domain-containing protein [Desulfatirhabdium butyrativorans]
MPGGDRTGPMGMGAMSGRATGYCSGAGTPGYANPGLGRGMGSGFGRGRCAWSGGYGGGRFGRRNMFYATGMPGWMRQGGVTSGGYPAASAQANVEMERQALSNQARMLQSQLDMIQKRLGDLEAKPKEE